MNIVKEEMHQLKSLTIQLTGQEVSDLLELVDNIQGTPDGTVRQTTDKLSMMLIKYKDNVNLPSSRLLKGLRLVNNE